MIVNNIGFSIYKKGEQQCLYCKMSCSGEGPGGCFLYKPNPTARLLVFGADQYAVDCFKVGRCIWSLI